MAWLATLFTIAGLHAGETLPPGIPTGDETVASPAGPATGRISRLNLPGAPVVTTVDPAPGTVTNLNRITVTFSEPVTGVSAEHFLVNDQPASGVAGDGAIYTFEFPAPPPGLVTVGWGTLHGIQDLDTPPEPFSHTDPGSQWAYQVLDPNGPAVILQQPSPNSLLRQLSEVVVGFNRPVTGLDAPDLVLDGQPAVEVTGIGAGPYRFRFDPPATAGPVTVQWRANHGIASVESIPHPFAGGSWSYRVDPQLAVPLVVINEILAENLGGIKDEDGDPEDWIELWNRGSAIVDLGGWALTVGDDPEDEWTLPSIALPPNSVFLVWASGKNRLGTGPRQELHTHFKLNPNGGRLRLLGPEQPRTPVAELEFGPQGPDYSFGFPSDGGVTVPRFFARPSPYAANGASSITNQTAEVKFSVERGYFEAPFRLTLSCETPGAVIRYTTNGSPPLAPGALLYTGPLSITSNQVVRAAAVAPDQMPSRSRTHTYLMGLPPEHRGLPAISLVTDSRNLFGQTGIMEVRPRNTTKRGPQWERPVSVEYLEPETGKGFQLDAGIRIQGGDYIRSLYDYRTTNVPQSKYSFRLYFRGEYGQGRLNWPLFPGTTVTSFDSVILRAGMNDPLNPFLKDEFVRRLCAGLGQPASHGTFAHLFLNGVYRGYYNPTERIDETFLREAHGDAEHWDLVAQKGEVQSGDGTAWAELLALADARTAIDEASHLEFARRMNLTNFIDYLLPNIYADTDDWPHNNWRAARKATPGALWNFYAWDAEWSFGQPNKHRPTFNTINKQLSSLNPPNGTVEIQRIFNALKVGREFQMLFSDRVHRAFFNGGPLEDARIRETYAETKALLRPELTVTNFNDAQISDWIKDRRRYVLTHLGLAGFNRSTNAPIFDPPGGMVEAGQTLDLFSLGWEIYYTVDGTDPRVPFTDAVSPTARLYQDPLVLDRTVHVKARSRSGASDWSALSEAVFTVADAGPSIRFSEINYNPPGGDAYEFIELVNASGIPVDLSGFSLDGVGFRFPIPFPALAPGARLVLANDDGPALFTARYPNVTVAGHYSGSLSNGGETLTLRDPAGVAVESVTWSDDTGWPPSADGGGSSLERADLSGDPNALDSWQASAAPGGSPGQSNSPAIVPAVRLNEISAQSGETNDWIELHNSGASPVDLSGWKLSDTLSQPDRWTFPAGTQIPPGGHLVIPCQPNAPAGGLVASFGLDLGGEELVLFNSTTNRVDSLAYGPQARGFTTGRDPVTRRWILCNPTPGSSNDPALMGHPQDVVLNEFVADSDDSNDWIELHNPSGRPVSLTGGFLATHDAVFRISVPAFLAPGGFAVFLADERPGPDHLNFKLPASGGRIEWRTPAGLVFDRIDYPPQVPLVSTGRLPDGSGAWTALPFSATPGASNYLATLGQTLRLSEFMAINAGGTLAPDGQPADWIELHHAGTGTLDLGGTQLRVNDSIAFTFPAGSTLAADARLLVWATGRDLPAGTPRLPVSLPDRGGVIRLDDPRGRRLDQIIYGSQLTNQSCGRSPQAWTLLAAPTPSEPNGVAAPLTSVSQVRINEWLTATPDGDEWLELFNPDSLPVDLGGCFLTDDISLSGLARFEIVPLSFLPPRGFVRFQSNGEWPGSPDQLSFRLSRWGESIRLSTPGLGLVDQMDFGVQVPGISEGRVPDGSDRIVPMPVPTPLAPNREQPLDTDGDGLPDDWELAYQLDPANPADSGLDLDGDGLTNGMEFAAGTDPTSAASRLAATVEWQDKPEVRFTAMPGRSYSVLVWDGTLENGQWRVLSHVEPGDSVRQLSVPDTNPATEAVRLYRVVTPASR